MIWNLHFTIIVLPEVISQHILKNQGPGPPSKCAPGYDSVDDCSIIKSYWLKSGVMQNKNRHISCLYFFHPGGKFWKGNLCVVSFRRGFCFWEIDISGILEHHHFQKVWISWFYALFQKLFPRAFHYAHETRSEILSRTLVSILRDLSPEV